ncbi:hypothetical protein [Mucilaginibacter ginsenosidivorax]|uniref:Uncharacterized protein n=1 Tax=Mucilaginibacter ginsenosidivorax TaxID=862126 RepID=A0A5B8W2R8_9SPHI|nr:hypothetical protein [Mucilaginibacter ginsenosidivorax]QEC78023.1 hypothetical protein FSB76_19540 [Mucilaginibacter ginsenosidivorax]
MKTSISSLIKKAAAIIAFLASSCFIYGFNRGMGDQEWLAWSNKCLTESFNPPPDITLKKWELILTNDCFLRLRKTYQHDRQEYFSFNLHRLNNVEYMGSDTTGTLKLSTLTDDIIVQTYEDPKGDLDSMATAIELPVKHMSPVRLDSLKIALNYFKAKSL